MTDTAIMYGVQRTGYAARHTDEVLHKHGVEIAALRSGPRSPERRRAVSQPARPSLTARDSRGRGRPAPHCT